MSKSKEELKEEATFENEAREDSSPKEKDNYSIKMKKKLAERKRVTRKRK